MIARGGGADFPALLILQRIMWFVKFNGIFLLQSIYSPSSICLDYDFIGSTALLEAAIKREFYMDSPRASLAWHTSKRPSGFAFHYWPLFPPPHLSASLWPLLEIAVGSFIPYASHSNNEYFHLKFCQGIPSAGWDISYSIELQRSTSYTRVC